ncbi:MAG TPA: hypothetical protein VF678_08580 [bacterium]
MNSRFALLARRLAVAGLLLLAGMPAAHAQTYGNLGKSYTPGKAAVGFAYSQTKRELDFKATAHTSAGSATASDTIDMDPTRQMLTLEYGVNSTTAVGAQLGKLTFDGDDAPEGTEFGFQFRHQLKDDPSGYSTGVMVGLRNASLSDPFESGPFQQIDFGFGFGKSFSPNAVGYVDVIYSKINGSLTGSGKAKRQLADDLTAILGTPVTVSSLKGDLHESNAVILAVGTEIQSGSGTITLEAHAGADSGVAVGFQIGL